MLTVPRPRRPVSPAPGLDAVVGGHVARWQTYTLQANVAFESGRDVEARRLYEEALAVADSVLNAAVERDRDAARYGLLLFGNACNNIVMLARRQNDIETEGIFLYRAIERFIEVARAGRAPLRLRSRSLLHLKVASEALYGYFERSGMWDAAAGYSERANAAMFEVQRLEADARRRARASSSAARKALALSAGARTPVEVACSPAETRLRALGDDPEEDDIFHVMPDTTPPEAE